MALGGAIWCDSWSSREAGEFVFFGGGGGGGVGLFLFGGGDGKEPDRALANDKLENPHGKGRSASGGSYQPSFRPWNAAANRRVESEQRDKGGGRRLPGGVLGRRGLLAATRSNFSAHHGEDDEFLARTYALCCSMRPNRNCIFELRWAKLRSRWTDVRIKRGRACAGVAQHGEPWVVPDKAKDKRFLAKVDREEQDRNAVDRRVSVRSAILLGVFDAIHCGENPTVSIRRDLKLLEDLSVCRHWWRTAAVRNSRAPHHRMMHFTL